MILEDLDGDDFVCTLFPAFHHLTECAAAEELENLRKKEEGQSMRISDKIHTKFYYKSTIKTRV